MNFRDDKRDAPMIPVLDEAKLFGFERLHKTPDNDVRDDAVEPEAAVATAFNKRGEGPANLQ